MDGAVRSNAFPRGAESADGKGRSAVGRPAVSEKAPTGDAPRSGILLRTEGLTKHFGSLVAVGGIDLEVRQGELRAIIGPNGAGKSTFFDLITGRVRVTKGQVFFKGEEITGLRPHEIVRRGLGRAFQLSRTFPSLTVVENIQAAIQARRRHQNPFRDIAALEDTWIHAEKIAVDIGLEAKADVRSSELSHGDQRLLEIGITLGTEPELLLLDEPTAGLSPGETEATVERVRKLAATRTILLVEHDMRVVMSLAMTITVFHQGQVIATGAPSEVVEDEQVRRVYLTRGA